MIDYRICYNLIMDKILITALIFLGLLFSLGIISPAAFADFSSRLVAVAVLMSLPLGVRILIGVVD